jgi:uncharacterized protein
MTAAAWVIVSVSAGTMAQAVCGIGLVLICGPVLLAVAGPADGVRLALIASLLVNAVLLALYGKHVRYRDALALFVPAAVTAVTLGLVLRGADTRTAGAAAGAAIVLAAVASWRDRGWSWMNTTAGTLGAGAVSGAMNVLSASAGPVAALYAVNAGWPARSRMATLQAYFAALNVIAIAEAGLPTHAGLTAAAAFGVPTGLGAGRALARRVPPRLGRRIVLVVAAGGGLAVLIQFLI